MRKMANPVPVLLIFNPSAGIQTESAAHLQTILTEMQALNFLPEVYLIQPIHNLSDVVGQAIQRGCQMVVASGGDGTVNSVASEMAGKNATLGIIPTGTKNNVALSLGIPADIHAAVEILQSGRTEKIDLGLASCIGNERPFLEVCTIGLFSALFPAADEFQKGNLARIGDLFSTLVSFPLADIRMVFDRQREELTQGHAVLISNMTYTGPNYQVAEKDSFRDGLLDVLVFSSPSKIDLVGAAIQSFGVRGDDPRIIRHQVRSLLVETNPPMPVFADGFSAGEGPLRIEVLSQALNVMMPAA